ncbi:MAG: protein disulfide isomerase family protein [bacterium]|nr:protein disulfide isomerase family protein [bacterium]
MKKTSITASVIIIIGIFVTIFIFAKKSTTEDVENSTSKNLATFAQCLASKNITMYGAQWCSHCQREKALFGEAFKYVPYIECPENEKLCLDAGINGYPTWIDGSGTKYEGEQGLDGLAKISGCPL